MSKHTPEPWTVGKIDNGNTWVVRDRTGLALAKFWHFLVEQDDANPARVCAAVNACQGIPTEALESGAVAELVEAAESLIAGLQAMFGDDLHKYKAVAKRVASLQSALAKLRPQS